MNFSVFDDKSLYEATSFYKGDKIFKKNIMFKHEQIKKDLKYGGALFDSRDDKHTIVVAHDNGVVAGVIKIKVGGCESYKANGFCNWVDFLSVSDNYQNQGISKKLFDIAFKWLHDNGHDHILASGYSSKGFFFAKDNFRKTAEKYNLRWKDEDKIGFPDKDNDGDYIYDKDKLLAA